MLHAQPDDDIKFRSVEILVWNFILYFGLQDVVRLLETF